MAGKNVSGMTPLSFLYFSLSKSGTPFLVPFLSPLLVPFPTLSTPRRLYTFSPRSVNQNRATSAVNSRRSSVSVKLISMVVWRLGHWIWSRVRFPAAAANTALMDDRLGRGKPAQYFTKPPRQTQPPTLLGTVNKYRPKCGDILRLGSKGRMAHSVCG